MTPTSTVIKSTIAAIGLLAWSITIAVVARGCGRDSSAPPTIHAPESTRTEPAKDTRKWDEPRETAPPYVIQVLAPPTADRQRIGERIDRPDLNREFTPENIEAQRQLKLITDEQADAALASYRQEQDRLAKENRALKDRIIQFEREMVARSTIPPSPWGGVATATTSRITGVTDIDFERNPRPRVNWLWDFGVGARYEWSAAEIDNIVSDSPVATTTAQTADAHVFLEPAEFGKRFPTLLRLEIAYEKVIEGDLEGKGWKGTVLMDTHFNKDRLVKK